MLVPQQTNVQMQMQGQPFQQPEFYRCTNSTHKYNGIACCSTIMVCQCNPCYSNKELRCKEVQHSTVLHPAPITWNPLHVSCCFFSCFSIAMRTFCSCYEILCGYISCYEYQSSIFCAADSWLSTTPLHLSWLLALTMNQCTVLQFNYIFLYLQMKGQTYRSF